MDYITAHRILYGPLGEHIARAALLFGERLMRPGFPTPVIRLAPVSPYGHCMGSSWNSEALAHVPQLAHGVWLYLHASWYGADPACLEQIDQVVLHELVHCELRYFGEDPYHKSAAWARRCQELSDRLGLVVRIERPRSIRKGTTVTTATPPGCLPYRALVRWPWSLLPGEPTLRVRASAA
jgi:hypothetical protein